MPISFCHDPPCSTIPLEVREEVFETLGGTQVDFSAVCTPVTPPTPEDEGTTFSADDLEALPNGGGALPYSAARRIVVSGFTGADIQKAIDQVLEYEVPDPGSGGMLVDATYPVRTVSIPQGTYTLEAPIVIDSSPSKRRCGLRIEGEFAILDANELPVGLLIKGTFPYLEVSGLVVENSVFGIHVAEASGPMVLEQVVARDVEFGFFVRHTADVTFRQCAAVACALDGWLIQGGHHVVVQGCLASSQRTGFSLGGGLGLGVDLSYLTSEGLGDSGVVVAPSSQLALLRSSHLRGDKLSGVDVGGEHCMIHGVLAHGVQDEPASAATYEPVRLNKSSLGISVGSCHFGGGPDGVGNMKEGVLAVGVPPCDREHYSDANLSLSGTSVAAPIGPLPADGTEPLVSMTPALSTLKTEGEPSYCPWPGGSDSRS